MFCEKPLAFNAHDAGVIRDAAKAAGVTHQVGLVMRFSPVISVTRDLINDPASGRPMTCVMIDDQFFPIQGHYASTWRGDARYVGAGTLLEHAIHDVDILISYFGRVRRVYGVTRHFFEREGVEDLSSAIIEFEGGTVVSHTSIWHNVLHRGSSRRMSVTCENAQYSWEDDDYAGAIRCETNTEGKRTDIPSEEVIERFLEERRRDRAAPARDGDAARPRPGVPARGLHVPQGGERRSPELARLRRRASTRTRSSMRSTSRRRLGQPVDVA